MADPKFRDLKEQREGGQLTLRYMVSKVSISDLVPHEGILDWHLKEIREQIKKDGYLARPIAVSSLESVGKEWRGKFMIHDGHHRKAALENLGCSFIMCSVFDFFDPKIKVFDYDTESIPIAKEEVIRKAISGKNITPRFDKHFIELNGKLLPFHNNSMIEPEIFVKLDELK